MNSRLKVLIDFFITGAMLVQSLLQLRQSRFSRMGSGPQEFSQRLGLLFGGLVEIFSPLKPNFLRRKFLLPSLALGVRRNRRCVIMYYGNVNFPKKSGVLATSHFLKVWIFA